MKHIPSTTHTHTCTHAHARMQTYRSKYDHEVSMVPKRLFQKRGLTLEAKKRIIQRAQKEKCKIIAESPASPTMGKLYKVECEKDGEVLSVIQSPEDPPMLVPSPKVEKVVTHQSGPAICCVLQLLPIVAAAAMKTDVNECHGYHIKILGRSSKQVGSRRFFATQVLETTGVTFINARDVRVCLDVLFDQPGSVWQVCEWYAPRSISNVFGQGKCRV